MPSSWNRGSNRPECRAWGSGPWTPARGGPGRPQCPRRRGLRQCGRGAAPAGRPRLGGDHRLHLRHHGRPQGRPHHARQLRRPGAERGRRLHRGGPRGRQHHHLPADGPRAGPRAAADLPGQRHADCAPVRPPGRRARPRRPEAHLPRGGPPRAAEDPGLRRGGRREEAPRTGVGIRAAHRGRLGPVRRSPRRRPGRQGRAGPAGSGTPCSTACSTPGSGS